MGCNCKGNGKKSNLNNLNNIDFINYAKQVYNDVIVGKTLEEYSDLDKVEIISAYSSLYPNSSVLPSIEDGIRNIKDAIEQFDNNNSYTKIKR
jgi:predicted nucleic acid-binding protein